MVFIPLTMLEIYDRKSVETAEFLSVTARDKRRNTKSAKKKNKIFVEAVTAVTAATEAL